MKFRLLLAVFVIALLLVSPVRAIGNGVPDGNGHPNVGAIAVEFEPGQKVFICSGSLASATVFLTAAHCLAFLPEIGVEASEVFVTFESNVLSARKFIQATAFHFDPLFGHDLGDLHDLGVIILPSRSTKGITPVVLPKAGLLDQMAQNGGLVGQEFVNVGYGVVPSIKGAPPSFSFDGERRVSTSLFQALDQAWLRLLMNTDATDLGGVCFGDSGSPHFLPGTNTIVATTTGGDAICRAENFNYRLDTEMARSFLRQFVTLP
jgi:V8-like Glu-specific endopeptidase